MRVAYVPTHAHGDLTHPDVEVGKVSTWNTRFVFVRFDKSVAKFGWDGATSQSCDPADLVHLQEPIMKECPLCHKTFEFDTNPLCPECKNRVDEECNP